MVSSDMHRIIYSRAVAYSNRTKKFVNVTTWSPDPIVQEFFAEKQLTEIIFLDQCRILGLLSHQEVTELWITCG